MARAGHAGRLTAEWLTFYGVEEGRTPSGYTPERVLGWPDFEREARHDFVCNPCLKEKLKAKYRARYGKWPPPVEGEKPGGK